MGEPIKVRDAAVMVGCSTMPIRDMIKRGELPGAFMGISKGNRAAMFITPDDLEKVIAHMKRPGARRVTQKKITRNGAELFSCSACDKFLPRHEFYTAKKPSSHGIRTVCKECGDIACRIYKADNEISLLKKSRAARHKRKKWVRKEGARLMREYANEAHIDGDTVLAAIEERFTGAGESQISTTLHLSDGVLRRARGKKITLDKADRLLTAAGIPGLLHELAPPPTLPGWSKLHDSCQGPMCGTIEVPHHAHGLCERCWWWKKTGRQRPLTGGWSVYHGACVRCKSTESPHSGRGLCTKCRYTIRHTPEFDKYKPCYPARR